LPKHSAFARRAAPQNVGLEADQLAVLQRADGAWLKTKNRILNGDDRPISPAIRFNAGHSLRRVVWFLGFRFSSKRSLTTTGSGVKSMRQAEAIRQPNAKVAPSPADPTGTAVRF